MEANTKKQSVHHVLAHSYVVHFTAFLVGVVLDLVFKLKVFNDSVMLYVGFVLMILATGLILWAQRTSSKLDIVNLSKDTFHKGPYKYTRGPTHLGLFLLLLSFGIIANAFFVIFCTIAAFFITRYVFLTKQEKMLIEKYGTHYLEYKDKVKF
jgi:protein-S-isoprenylcysteine O-methyltransferase Ste14